MTIVILWQLGFRIFFCFLCTVHGCNCFGRARKNYSILFNIFRALFPTPTRKRSEMETSTRARCPFFHQLSSFLYCYVLNMGFLLLILYLHRVLSYGLPSYVDSASGTWWLSVVPTISTHFLDPCQVRPPQLPNAANLSSKGKPTCHIRISDLAPGSLISTSWWNHNCLT